MARATRVPHRNIFLEMSHGDMETRSDLLSVRAHGKQRAEGNRRVCGKLRSVARKARRARRRRCRSWLGGIWAHRRPRGDAQYGRRVASLRLERVQFVSVSERAASAYGAPLSGRAGAAL